MAKRKGTRKSKGNARRANKAARRRVKQIYNKSKNTIIKKKVAIKRTNVVITLAGLALVVALFILYTNSSITGRASTGYKIPANCDNGNWLVCNGVYADGGNVAWYDYTVTATNSMAFWDFDLSSIHPKSRVMAISTLQDAYETYEPIYCSVTMRLRVSKNNGSTYVTLGGYDISSGTESTFNVTGLGGTTWNASTDFLKGNFKMNISATSKSCSDVQDAIQPRIDFIRVDVRTIDPNLNISIQHPQNITYTQSPRLNFTWWNAKENALHQCRYMIDNTTNTTVTCTTNNTVLSGLSSGSHFVQMWAMDDTLVANESNVIYFTYQAPPAVPQITFVSPSDGSGDTVTRNNTYINVSLNTAGNLALLEWDGINESMISQNSTIYSLNKTAVDGTYTYKVWANSTDGMWNVSDTRTITFNTVAPTPQITFVSPTDNSGTTVPRNSTIINVSVSVASNAALLEWNAVNESMTAANATIFYINKSAANGLYTYSVWANSTNGIWNVSETRTITLNATAPETTPPGVVINAPAAIANYSEGASVVLNVTVSDTSGISAVYANITKPDASVAQTSLTNSSASGFTATFTDTATIGIYNVTFIANDTLNNINATMTTQFRVLNGTPTVTLLYPLDGNQTIISNVSFNYTVTAEDSITNCTLLISDEVDQINTSIEKDITLSFVKEFLSADTYGWDIKCSTPVRSSRGTSPDNNSRQIIIETPPTGDGTTEIPTTPTTTPSTGGGGGGGIVSHIFTMSAQSGLSTTAKGRQMIAVDVKNSGSVDENNVIVSVTNCPSGWYCSSTIISKLVEDSSTRVYIEINVADVASPGVYNLNVAAKNNAISNEVPVIFTVSALCNKNADCGSGSACSSGVCQPLFDIKIIRADSPIEPGEFLDFTYFVKSVVGQADDYTINYSIGNITSGSEVIYVPQGTEQQGKSSLFIPTNAPLGTYDFYLKLSRGTYRVEAKTRIEVARNAPVIVDLDMPMLQISEKNEFGLIIGTNKDRPILVSLDEKLTKGSAILWQNKKDIEVTKVVNSMEDIGKLQPGNYTISILASYGNRTASLSRTFEVQGPPAQALPPEETLPFGVPKTIAGINTIDIITVLSVLLLILFVILFYVYILRKPYKSVRTGKKGIVHD